jgi:hypothetical protein
MALSRHFFLPFAADMQTDAHFAHRVEVQMKPIVHLFTPIFFVMVGLSLNLREIDWSSPTVWGLSGCLIVADLIGKLAAGLALPGETRFTRWAVGLSMIPRGEVGLIFAELGRTTGIFDNTIYAAMIIVTPSPPSSPHSSCAPSTPAPVPTNSPAFLRHAPLRPAQTRPPRPAPPRPATASRPPPPRLTPRHEEALGESPLLQKGPLQFA